MSPLVEAASSKRFRPDGHNESYVGVVVFEGLAASVAETMAHDRHGPVSTPADR